MIQLGTLKTREEMEKEQDIQLRIRALELTPQTVAGLDLSNKAFLDNAKKTYEFIKGE